MTPRALLLTQDGTKRSPGAERSGSSMPSRHSSGGSAPLPADPGPPSPKTEISPLPPGRRRGCSPAAAAHGERLPSLGPHLPSPAGSQRGGAGLCGAEGGYILRRGGQQERPRSHPPAGSLKAEGWRPRSRLSTESGGRGRKTR